MLISENIACINNFNYLLVGHVLYQDLLGLITMIKGEFNNGVSIVGLKTCWKLFFVIYLNQQRKTKSRSRKCIKYFFLHNNGRITCLQPFLHMKFKLECHTLPLPSILLQSHFTTFFIWNKFYYLQSANSFMCNIHSELDEELQIKLQILWHTVIIQLMKETSLLDSNVVRDMIISKWSVKKFWVQECNKLLMSLKFIEHVKKRHPLTCTIWCSAPLLRMQVFCGTTLSMTECLSLFWRITVSSKHWKPNTQWHSITSHKNLIIICGHHNKVKESCSLTKNIFMFLQQNSIWWQGKFCLIKLVQIKQRKENKSSVKTQLIFSFMALATCFRINQSRIRPL